jgi:hypothetical protein
MHRFTHVPLGPAALFVTDTIMGGGILAVVVAGERPAGRRNPKP